jgi:LysM repeat protein
MNLYEFYSSNKKVNITEDLIHAKDVESEVIIENLNKWFKEKWVRFGPDGKIRGDCARGDDSEGKPKCLPRSKAQSLGKKGRASAASKKRREDPNPERRGSAINVSTKVKEDQEFKFTPDQEKWLGGADRTDPYILARMPGPKPPVSYFTNPTDQTTAKNIQRSQNLAAKWQKFRQSNPISNKIINKIPGINQAASAVDVGSKLVQGDLSGAGRQAVGMIPGARNINTALQVRDVARNLSSGNIKDAGMGALGIAAGRGNKGASNVLKGVKNIQKAQKAVNMFEDKVRAQAQRAIAAQSGRQSRTQTPAPVQQVDPNAAARAATRKAIATNVSTPPPSPASAPTVSSSQTGTKERLPVIKPPEQRANLGIVDQGLSRLAGNLVKRDGKWFHPGGAPVTNPELIKKAETSITRPPGTTASGRVRPEPTTGVSSDLASALSSGGSDNDRTSASASTSLPLPSLPSGPTSSQSVSGTSVMSTTPDYLTPEKPTSTPITDREREAMSKANTEPQSQEPIKTRQQMSPSQRDAEDQELSRLAISKPNIQNSTTIRRGDTLSSIARQSGTTVGELMRLNPQIKDPNKIFAGDKINLPSLPGRTATSSTDIEPKPSARPAVTPATQRINQTEPSQSGVSTISTPQKTTAVSVDQQQQLRSNLTPEQLKYAGNADLSRPDTGSTGVIQRMPLPNPEELAAAISNAESQKNPDISYGDVVRNGQIVSTIKANKGPDKGKPLLTAEQWSKQNLGDSKKLSDMTIDEVMRFQKYRSDNHTSANAVGAYQFVGRTLEDKIKSAGIDPKTTKFDQATQDILLNELTKENASVLKRNGIIPDKVNLYMAHAVGGRGAVDIYDNLRQNPNKTVIDSLMDGWKKRNPNDSRNSEKVEAQRRRLLAGNPHFRDMEVGEFYNYLDGATKGNRRNTDYYRRTRTNRIQEEACPHCRGPMFNIDMLTEKKDACYYKVKSRYKVWPSAYASGALVKCRKKGAKNWGKSKTNEDTNLYFNIVGTDKKTLISEFKLQHNARGWYLTENSSSSLKLDAVRAFGMPLSEEELNPIAYSGTAATIDTDNSKSPVGSIPKSQRINKRRGKV